MSESKDLLAADGGSINPTPAPRPKQQDLVGAVPNGMINNQEEELEKVEDSLETYDA